MCFCGESREEPTAIDVEACAIGGTCGDCYVCRGTGTGDEKVLV